MSGDISSAAFWMVAASAHPNARIRLANVGVNPTRAGVLDVLRDMGARISVENPRDGRRGAGGRPPHRIQRAKRRGV